MTEGGASREPDGEAPPVPPPSTFDPPPAFPAATLQYLRPLFHEQQHLRGSRAVYVVAGVFGLMVAVILATMITLGAVVWLVIQIVALVAVVILSLMLTSSMTTLVDAAGVHVRYFPFLRKTFALDEIVGWEAQTYDPMEYGGWGVRGWPDRYGWAYNVRGNRGVLIEFRNGHRLMLGSQRAEELARAIEEAKSGAAPLPAPDSVSSRLPPTPPG